MVLENQAFSLFMAPLVDMSLFFWGVFSPGLAPRDLPGLVCEPHACQDRQDSE